MNSGRKGSLIEPAKPSGAEKTAEEIIFSKLQKVTVAIRRMFTSRLLLLKTDLLAVSHSRYTIIQCRH